MVRVNIINPKYLADQHLRAEYLEIIMLVTYVRKHPEIKKELPKKYCLGTGHILFFKNKLKYLKKRHEQLKKEMLKRGFKANQTINVSGLPKQLQKDWKPTAADKEIIKKRLIARISLKPSFYNYYKKKYPKDFLVNLVKKA
ncbi:pyrimidine dimer DNA glycosylase/endonuclease V [Candidatus Woesearchaeota archaeon]|nr:pyrimidine dimer DNA glycosylase/endonuclease V [Candidatus Woesearchaeota archaeon]